MLDTRRMQILAAVVASGSLSAAAGNLGYTPSAISQQVSTLEREVGLPLLERIGRGVRPTAAGALLAERAGQVADVLSRTETELAELRAGRTGLLRLRFFETASIGLVPRAVAMFRRERPEVRLELGTVDDGGLHELSSGDADMAIVVVARDIPEVRGVRVLHLVDEPYLLVLPQDHPLCEGDSVELAQLADQQWISDGLVRGACAEVLAGIFATAGFSPRIALEAEGSYAMQAFVAAGLGVALIPRLGLEFVHPGVEVRPVRQPNAARRLYVAVREAVAEQPPTQALLDALLSAAAA